MKLILANPKVVNPIKTIREGILIKTGIKLPVITSNLYVEHDDEVIIRWANSLPIKGKDTRFNSAEFIQTAGNKLTCSKWLARNSIETIIFYNDNDPNENLFPIFIRKTLNGKGGDGIVICKTRDEFVENFELGNVWSFYTNFSSEYRIHVMGGTIARIFKKVLRDGEVEDKYPIRNLKKYDFSLRTDIEAFPKIKELVEQISPIAKGIGGNFFALDVGISNDKHLDVPIKTPIVIEINTGPGLSDNTADYYVDYFIKELL